MRTMTWRLHAALLAGLLTALVTACGNDEAPHEFEAGELGAVEIGAGEAIHIRTLLTHSVAREIGDPMRHSIEIAVRDFGEIRGRRVDLGEPIDTMCSGTGGKAAALQVTADPQGIVGVLGTTCSGAAVTASPLLSGAGLVMISPSNTSPQLTSDLAGNASAGYHPGYFRTANNDLYEGSTLADFAYYQLGLRHMATVDDGDPYTMGLTVAFAHAFGALGGEVVATARVDKGQTDMTAVLAGISAGNDVAAPDGIFFPLFSAEGTPFAAQAKASAALEGVTLITSSALLSPGFLATPQSLGVYFAGPEPLDETNVNEATGRSTAEVLADYQSLHGEPETPFWVHAYDAAALLLSAVDAVATERQDRLYVDRAALRQAIAETENFEGLLGLLSCDDFGDCGTGGVSVYHHTDGSVTDPAQLAEVYP